MMKCSIRVRRFHQFAFLPLFTKLGLAVSLLVELFRALSLNLAVKLLPLGILHFSFVGCFHRLRFLPLWNLSATFASLTALSLRV
jgi:hypothetical protein